MSKFYCSLVLLMSFFYQSSLLAYDKDDYARLFTSHECKRCDLYRANLSGLDLTGVNLEGADLKYANLKKTTLFRANLNGARIDGAKFDGALWLDGQFICQKGSVGRCISKKRADEEADN